MTYGSRFKTLFPDDASVDPWIETWHDGLKGITGEQMKYGVELMQRTFIDFPPTLPQFRGCCIAMPKPYVALPKQDWESTSEVAKESMAKIRAMLAAPRRPPGKWWASEIMEKVNRGEKVAPICKQFAEEVLYGK